MYLILSDHFGTFIWHSLTIREIVHGQNAGTRNTPGQNVSQNCKGELNARQFWGGVDKMPVL